MSKKIISLILIFLLVGAVVVSCKKKKQEAGESESQTEQNITTESETETNSETDAETDSETESEAESESESETESESESEDEAPTFHEILVSELENYMIVYPEGSSDDVKKTVNDLAQAISNRYGVTVPSKNDNPVNYMGESQVGEYEILVGDCRRDESQALLSELEYNDRGYRLDGKKLVIASHDAFTTLSLVSEISSIVRAQKDNTVFFNSDMDKIYCGKYNYETMTLGGHDISEYIIVYPKESKFDANLAQKLRRAIAEECGSLLEVVSDKEEAAAYEIIIGSTSRIKEPTALKGASVGAGYTALSGDTLVLYGKDALGSAVAVDSFIGLFRDAEDVDILELSVSDGIVYDTGVDSSMSFNLTASGKNSARVKRVVETIVKYLPDTVGLQECSPEWKNSLLTELGDYYGYVGTGRDAKGTGLSTGILYAKHKLTVVDSGTRWLSYTPDQVSKLGGADANYTYTWAKLKNNKGQTFITLNTQLGNTAAVRAEQASILLDVMYGMRDTAIIFTADMGCAEGSEPFNTLLCEFMRHSAAICASDKMGSFTQSNLTDTLLIYDKYIDVYYMEVAYSRIDGAFASDSRAAYIEYVIDMNGTSYTQSGTSDDKLTVVPDRDGTGYDPLDPAA